MTLNPSITRRTFLAAVGVTGAGAALTACAGTGGSTDSANDSGDGAATDTIVWWSNHPANSKDVELELISRFEAENPGLSVQLVDAGANYAEVSQKFNAALSGGDLPDVVVLSDTEWFNFALNGTTANMDELTARNGIDTTSYVPSLFNDYAHDGGHYGLPFARSTTLFYYNKDLWRQAGLPDRGPESWEEFSEWGPRLQEARGGNGHALGWGDATSYLSWTFEGPMWSMGGNYSVDWASRMTTPETIATVEWLRDTVADGWATISTDVTNEFTTGLIGSCIQSTGDLSSVSGAATFDWGVAPLPNPTGEGACPTGGAGLGIPANISEERQNNAVKFIDFITNTQNTGFWSRETGYVPVRTDAARDPEHAAFLEANPAYNVAVEQLPDTRVQDNFRVLLPNGDRTIGDALERICLTGADVDVAMAEAENQLNTIFKRDIEPLL